MPKDGGLVFKYQVPFKKQMMFPLPHQPDVLASHIRWSPDADELFDKDSSFRFTIVRSPAKLFPSIFNYFQRLNPIFKQARTLERFLANPQQFTAESKKPQFTTRNSMSFQMGGDMYLNRDPSDEELDAIRASLADKFDLILVADHLPQSLILLRHQLCLSINDIASMSKNVAKRAPSRIDLTDQINKWQTVDSVIFAEANRTLWERVEQFGLGRMREEVEALTRRNEQLNEECVKSYKPVKQLPREFQDYEPPGVRIDGIELNDDVEQLCTDIALSPFAHAIDIQDNQCQDSTFLRKFARLESRAKTIHPWCSSKN